MGEFGKTEIGTPRDRNSLFEPKLIGQHQRRFPGFDQKIDALIAKGMTTGDIADPNTVFNLSGSAFIGLPSWLRSQL